MFEDDFPFPHIGGICDSSLKSISIGKGRFPASHVSLPFTGANLRISHDFVFFNSDWMWIDTRIIRCNIFPRTSYPSSHNHGSKKWVPPILVSVHLGWFSISMIMGERVIQGWRFLPIVWRFLNTPPIQCKQVDHVFATLPDLRGSPQEM